MVNLTQRQENLISILHLAEKDRMVLLQVLMALFTLTRGMETIQAVLIQRPENLTILEPPTKGQMVGVLV